MENSITTFFQEAVAVKTGSDGKLLQKVPMQGEKLVLGVTFTGELSLSIGIAIQTILQS